MRPWWCGQTQRALFIILLAVAGCQSAPALLTEDRVADFAAIKAKAASIGMTTSRISLDGTRGPGLEMAIHESTAANPDRTIVFIHGVFSDSRMWRYLCWELAGDYRVMAIDLLGCGASDRPDPSRLGQGGYSPNALGRDVLFALRQRLAELPAQARLTLVGHSLGAMTILNMWAEPAIRAEFADVLERVDSVVLIAPPDITANCRTRTFQEIDRMDDFRMTFVDLFGILQRRVVLATRDGVVDPSLATQEEAQRLMQILRDRSTRRAGQAMLRQAIPKSKDACHQIVSAYANVKAPCLIIWGAQDDIFPSSMAYKIVDRLPDAQLRIVNSAMHGIATERPAVCANLVRDFVSGKPTAAAAGGSGTPARHSKIIVLDPSQPASPDHHPRPISTLSSPAR